MRPRSTRDIIVEASDDLFYRRGYEHTSLADIAGVVGLSRGNFYHHFKTKDAILDEVIALRLDRTRSMLEQWELANSDPARRIDSFVTMLITNGSKIRKHGCPVGTLCSELAKLDHSAKGRADDVFKLFQRWLARQFALAGRKADADTLAMHLLGRSQGIATLATAFRDESFVRREVDALKIWLGQQLRGVAPKH